MTPENPERILVVDDDPRNVRLLEGIFRTAGYAVDKAYSGSEALARVQEVPPDLVLLDVMMPGMSGHEVCSRLKRGDRTRSIPVVLVTSLSSSEDKIEGLDLGAEDFVSKPVNRLELLAKTRSLLRIKMLHDEVARAKEQLERKNQELMRLEDLKDTLVQMVVHDLKNPLTAIMGNLDLILQSTGAECPRNERRIRVALDSSRSMMRLILDLLDIGRLEENKMTLELEDLNVSRLFEDCVTENGALLAQARLTLEQTLAPDLSTVRADRDLVGRILANLVSNAIKHTPEGGTITVGAENRGDDVVLFVTDTGQGIAPEFHERIFEKFAQAEVKRNGQKTDRGLGLTFCRMAAEAHGGRIWVSSVPEKGSTFYVAFPADPAGRPLAPGEEPTMIAANAQETLR